MHDFEPLGVTVPTEVLFIGGRAGVGKSTLGWTIGQALGAADVPVAYVEGDTIDQAWPEPWAHQLAEKNLTAIWTNYRQLGFSRLVYTNTAATRADCQPSLVEALEAAGGPVTTRSVLLTSSDVVAAERLSTREQGDSLEWHLERSRLASLELAEQAVDDALLLDTDGRTPDQLAAQVIEWVGWLP